MKNFLLLLTTIMKMQWRRRSKVKGDRLVIVTVVSIAIAYVFIMGSALIGIVFSTQLFKDVSGIPEFIFMITLVGMTMVVLFGTMAMLSFVYFNKDAEFLASLPIKSGTIFMAKMTIVYIYEFISSFALMFLPLLAVGISAGAGIQFYFGLLIALFIVPAIPLLLAALLAIPLMYLVTFFKSKAALSTIALVLVFGAIMLAYYIFMANIQQTSVDAEIDPMVVTSQLVLQIRSLSKIVYPLYLLANFMGANPVFGLSPVADSLLSIMLSIGIMLALIAITYFISNIVYARSVASQLENKKNSGKIKGTFEQGSAEVAIMKKDFKYLLRVPSFGFQCFSSVILTPLMIVAMSFYLNSMSIQTDEMVDGFMTGFNSVMACFMLFAFGGSMNITAASALSREGEGFSLIKMLPITPEQIVRAKLKLSLIITYIASSLGLTACFIMGGYLNILEFLYMAILLYVFVYFMAHFAFMFDLKAPKLNWTSPNEAVKQNKSATLSILLGMMLSMCIAIPFAVVKILLAAFYAPTDSFYIINMAITFIVLLVITGLGAYFVRKHVYTNLERYWYNIVI